MSPKECVAKLNACKPQLLWDNRPVIGDFVCARPGTFNIFKAYLTLTMDVTAKEIEMNTPQQLQKVICRRLINNLHELIEVAEDYL